MKSMNVFFHSVTEVKEFVNIICNINGKVTLSDKRYTVDAKSIMGIYCLNLLEVLGLKIEEWEEKYEFMLAKYVV